MVPQQTFISSLVSVVIPCYNHGHYLGKAIDSVLAQQYAPIEVVVVDDGSTDNTAQVALNYGDRVRYVHKQNGGLSAARNTGIAHAKGEYIVFLDADDWLYPKAIETNLRYLQQNPKAAFVSGAHDKIFEVQNRIINVNKKVLMEHYMMFLSKGNYIGVPAVVMYRCWVLDEFRFDEDLKSCEDYDLYLRIARHYQVLHHEEKIAAYRIHLKNMSSDSVAMLQAALYVMEMQKKFLRGKREKKAWVNGKAYWKAHYYNELFNKLRLGTIKLTIKDFKMLLLNKPQYILRLLLKY